MGVGASSNSRARALACLIGCAVLTTALAGVTPSEGAAQPPPAAALPPMVPMGFRLAGSAPTPGDPLRVWVLGDSVMHDASPALAAALAATGDAKVVADSTFGGWGLTQQAAWIADSQQIIEDYHPQVVVGTWSWDDQMAGASEQDYAALLRQALGVWMAPGDGVELVVLVQFPQGGPNPLWPAGVERQRMWVERTREQNDWDAIAEQVVGDFPGHAVYLSTNAVFDPDGRFFTWMPAPGVGWVRTRQFDNTHLCPSGVTELTQLLMNDLQPILGLSPPNPGWQTGAWTMDPRYDAPDGIPSCPSDQPPPGYEGVVVPTPAGYPSHLRIPTW